MYKTLHKKQGSVTVQLRFARSSVTFCAKRDNCPGSRDFRTIRERKGAFMGEDDIQLVGFINCGGCPGKKAVLRARSLVEQGADTIAFASCISKGTPIGYSCPFAKRMRELVQKEVGDGVHILDYTHDAGPEPETSQK
jgi:predicted metal-binding protein